MARTTRSERDELNEEAERIFGKDAPFITGRYGYYAIDEKKGGRNFMTCLKLKEAVAVMRGILHGAELMEKVSESGDGDAAKEYRAEAMFGER